MRKLLVAIGAFVAVLAIGVGWLTWSNSVSLGSADLRAQVSNAVTSTPPGGSFAADSLVHERWDALYVVGPYTSSQQLRDELGSDWDRADKVDMEMDDDDCLLVFTTTDSVVAYAKVTRHLGDFSKAARPSAYRPEPRFTLALDPKDGNWPFIVAV